MLRSCHNIIILPCLELWHHLIHVLLQQYHYWIELNLMLYQKLSQNTIFYSQVSINPFSHLKLNIFEPLWNLYLFLINFHLYEASTTLTLDLCPDFMELVVRQASFPFLISQICLSYSSCDYIQFVFHTSCVLEIDRRQATYLIS